MKKITFVFSAFFIFTSFLFFSFKSSASKENSSLKLIVTSENSSPINFSLKLIGKNEEKYPKEIKNVKTPYEISVDSDDVKIICKMEQQKGKIIYKIERADKSGGTATWPISVFVINNNNIEIFGID